MADYESFRKTVEKFAKYLKGIYFAINPANSDAVKERDWFRARLAGVFSFLENEQARFSSEIKNRNEKIAGLEEQVQETCERLTQTESSLGGYREMSRRLLDEKITSKGAVKGLEDRTIKAERKAESYQEDLKKERSHRKDIIEKAIPERERERVREHRENLGKLAELSEQLRANAEEAVADAQKKLGYATLGIERRDMMIAALRGNVAVTSLRMLEDVPAFSHVIGVYLDDSYKPVYSTPAFLHITSSTEKGFTNELVPQLENYFAKNKGRKEGEELEFQYDKKQYHFKIHLREIKDRDANFIGTFVQFTPADKSLLEKLIGWKGRVQSNRLIEKLADDIQSLGETKISREPA